MGVRLKVRVHPGAQRPGLAGRLADGALKVAVAAPPEDGRANRAVEALLAEVLGLRRAQVRVVGGAATRLKHVEIVGLDAAEVQRRIAGALGERERGKVERSEREAAHGK
jgi:uncharacterized protein